MFDERTEKNLATLDPAAQDRFRFFIKEAKKISGIYGCEYIAICGNRSWKEQDAIYAIGRTILKNKKPVTNARGGQSNHNFRIALDFGVFKNGKYLDNDNPKLASSVHKAVAALSNQFKIEWGGIWKLFKDEPHFEIATGLTMAQKREKYLKEGTVL
jgi:peptidoglycan L-alanyl-D-glutamate endopeptidase CwlK